MIPAALLVLAVVAAIVQVGPLPAAFAQPLAAPILPVVLLAGWSAIRRPGEAALVPLGAAVVLGVVSEARVGLFLLALLPALALATIARQRDRRKHATLPRRLALAAGVGALGTACYVVMLTIAAGTTDLLTRATPALIGSMAWTGALAALLAVALWRVRLRSPGLFS